LRPKVTAGVCAARCGQCRTAAGARRPEPNVHLLGDPAVDLQHDEPKPLSATAREHRPVQQLRAEVGDPREVKTYFAKAPYHLEANTTWLFPNTSKKPLDDKQFRKALAYSINVGQIIDKAYQGLVNKASPTGLLPIWSKWIDKNVVKTYGFSYNTTKAKTLLAAAGYKT
jgi:ABC-type transport system substrate-binding protein